SIRLIFTEEAFDERIRTRGVIRRVREFKDVFIGSDRKSLTLPKFRVLQLFSQLFQKVSAPCLIAFKSDAEAVNGLPLFPYSISKLILSFRHVFFCRSMRARCGLYRVPFLWSVDRRSYQTVS